MMGRILCVALLFLWLSGTVHAAETSHVVLRLLDKVTARVSQMTLAKDESLRFGTLDIIMRHCDRTPPTEVPESTALLEILQTADDNRDNKLLFYGWMFASSPAVNPFQHPVYDVWVLECRNL